jgi:hypothetical protein
VYNDSLSFISWVKASASGGVLRPVRLTKGNSQVEQALLSPPPPLRPPEVVEEAAMALRRRYWRRSCEMRPQLPQ